jgi:hypothetical protein
MTPNEHIPSLLDWLKFHLAQPRLQRFIRFGLAALAAMWGAYQLVAGASLAGGFFLLGLAFGLAVWGLNTRSESLSMANMPQFSLGTRAADGAAEAFPQAARPLGLSSVLTLAPGLRLPAAFALAVVGQWVITGNKDNLWWGLFFYLCGLAAFGWMMWKDRLLPSPPPEGANALRPAEAGAEARPFTLRVWLAGPVLIASAAAFWTAGGNRFRTLGVMAWVIAVAGWLAMAWEGSVTDALAGWWTRLQSAWREGRFHLRFSRGMILLLGILVVGAYFRYYRLPSIPPEMTSDHVEKLLDVGDIVLHEQYKIFFERNTGREPLQFYLAFLTLKLFGTGLTHLTLKIGVAAAGLLMLPFIYLLGREIEDEAFGLLAALLAAISYWAVAISRVGLRFPFTPLFVAPTLYFLLRGVRRGTRNDFLLAGLALGVGLYGYSTIRVLPLAVLAAPVWFALWPQKNASRVRLAVNTALLFATTLVVFLPLFRYSTQRPDLFWERTLTRLSDTEQQLPGSPLGIFLSNNWNAAIFFNYGGEHGAWANTILEIPALDMVTGALFVFGAAYVMARFVARRDKVAGFLLLSMPILALPSTLALAFPRENPSFVRLGGLIPVVMVIAAYPLWLIFKQLRTRLPGRVAGWASAGALVVIAGGAAALTHDLYFARYAEQYRLAAQNASEIGAVIRAFAHSVGTYDTAYVRPYPHWTDTRAVGMYAGDFERDYAIREEDLARPQSDPRAKLFILNRYDFTTRPDGQSPTLPLLRQLYPDGKLSVYHSAIPYHDFLMYFVPGVEDVDETTLPPP